MRGRSSLFTNFQRAYEYYLEFDGAGGATPPITVRIPNGGPNGGGGGSNFPDDWWVWYEDAAFHERGHNWMAPKDPHLGR